MKKFRLVRGSLLFALVVSFLAAARCAGFAIGELRLIGVQTISKAEKFNDTGVGGLSGLDYVAATDEWLAVSDDKSEAGPSRFYTVKLDYDGEAFRSATVSAVTVLRQPDGSAYPSERGAKTGDVVPDFESLRVDPLDGSVWYAHEGLKRPQTDPLVRHAKRDGTFIENLPIPAALRFAAEKGSGARFNETFEGLSFSTDGKTLWLGMEGALQQDRAPAGSSARDPVRFTEVARDGEVIRQVVYVRDPVVPKIAEGEFADSGVSEILATSPESLLVLERSGSRTRADQVWRFGALLFAATIAEADNVASVEALGEQPVKTATKRLLYDFSQAGTRIDNLECIAFGRKLANGHDSLVVMADDNFNPNQENQVWVFEVVPASATQP